MPNLDFVRSVAVISVVVEHTLLALGIRNIGPYQVQYLGVLGVLVFFVLTSIVLMWSLERKPHTLDFYIRRLFRIYPLALAVTITTILFHAPVGGSPKEFFHYTHLDMLSMTGQITLLHAPNPPLISVMWTLPYEVDMYFLLPMVFFFVRRNFSIWPILLVWMMVLTNAIHSPSDRHNFAIAIGYFLPGIMAYVAYGRWKARLPGWMLPLFLLGVWAIFLYRFDFHKGWLFCLVCGLGLPLFRQMKSVLVLIPSRVIARYSYSVYLTHPFALVMGIYLLRGHSLALRLSVEAIFLIVLPVVAYHLIEHPLVKIGSRLASRAEHRHEQKTLKQYRTAV